MPTKISFLNTYIEKYSKITFIGMSGLGKSHWSKMLEQFGFTRFCCDDEITHRLFCGCDSQFDRTTDLGEWMGFPYEQGYEIKEKTYLSLEIDVLNEITDQLENSEPAEKIVIDTTGSAPYAGENVMQRLKEQSCIIYLAASKEYYTEMLERYIKFPRPVLWGDKYCQKKTETKKEALSRCYSELLTFRSTLYEKYAHFTIPYEIHRGHLV